jgi:hypothetical protein
MQETKTIQHKCGHVADRKIVAALQADIRNAAQKWSQSLCPTCAKAKAQETAQKINAQNDLPDLRGASDSQVSYANVLRAKAVKEVDRYIARCSGKLTGIDARPPMATSVIAEMHADRAIMLAHTDAKFWLNNRGVMALQNANRP